MPEPSLWVFANSKAKMNAGTTPSLMEKVGDWIQGIDLIITTRPNYHMRFYRTLAPPQLSRLQMPSRLIESHLDAAAPTFPALAWGRGRGEELTDQKDKSLPVESLWVHSPPLAAGKWRANGGQPRYPVPWGGVGFIALELGQRQLSDPNPLHHCHD